MNKSKIKNFAINARIKLIEAVKLEAAKLGISKKEIFHIDAEKDSGQGFHVKGIEHSFNEKYRIPRERLIKKIDSPGSSYDHVMEEVAYTWFNRLIAFKFIEMNNYLDHDLNILTSLTPTAIASRATTLFNLNKEEVFDLIQNNKDDELFKTIVIAQCNALNPQLPFLFEKINDYTELLFPSGMLNQESVIRQMNDIDEEDWKEVEIIGWMYQYYVKEKKDAIVGMNKGTVKKEDLPAATQLFTYKWIVQYMVQNSLGKLWFDMNPKTDLITGWEYFLKPRDSEFIYKKEKTRIEDIKFLDPCCGSGHILVYAFDIFYEIYKSEGYLINEIPRLILENNLLGLDICNRSVQLASFALIMKARLYSDSILNLKVNIFDFIDSQNINDQALSLICKTTEEKTEIKSLIEAFSNAKSFGSLINPDKIDYDLYLKRINSIENNLMFKQELEIQLTPILNQAKILSNYYDVVVTNPPYHNKYNTDVKAFIENNYKGYKADLYSAFIYKCNKLTKPNGYSGMMTPFTWMFIKTHEILRDYIITNRSISSLVQLEYSAYEEATVPICTFVIQNNTNSSNGEYVKLSDFKGAELQPIKLKEAVINPNKCFRYTANTKDFPSIPGSPIAYWASNKVRDIFKNNQKLNEDCSISEGIKTGDNKYYLRNWFEIDYTCFCDFSTQKCNLFETNFKYLYAPHHKGGEYRKWYGNYDDVIKWQNNGYEIKKAKNSGLQGAKNYFNQGITSSKISSAYFGVRLLPESYLFDSGSPTIFPNNTNELNYILGFLCSKLSSNFLKYINPTLNFQVGNIGSLPIIKSKNNKQTINNLVQECLNISKTDWNSNETSWKFKEHPLLTHNNGHKKIQDAFNHWQDFVDKQFYQLKSNEEELNKIFIEIYGLQDELTPEVEDKDVTVKKPLSCYQEETQREKAITEDVKSFLSYAVGCMMGRYFLDQEGLAYAGGEFDKTKYKTFEVDDDAILPVLGDCWFEDDIVTRFKEFVKITFGEKYLIENLEFIAKALGKTNKESSEDKIRSYFLKDFFKDHCKTYKKHPIYWMFTSGKEKAFNTLIYMHRYDKQTLARLRKDYLHELQAKVDRHIEFLEANNEKKKLSALIKQKEELKKYEELLKHYADQQIEFNLDDGVKHNYALFDKLVEKI